MKEIISFSKKGRPFIKGLVIRNSDEKFKGAVTILPERQSQQVVIRKSNIIYYFC